MSIDVAAETFARGFADHRAGLDATLSTLTRSGPEYRIHQKLSQAAKLYEKAMGRPDDATVYAGIEASDQSRTVEYRQGKMAEEYDQAQAEAADEIAQADALLAEVSALAESNSIVDPKVSEGHLLSAKADVRYALDGAPDPGRLLDKVRDLAIAARRAGDTVTPHTLTSPAMASYWTARGVDPAAVRKIVAEFAADERFGPWIGGGRDAQALSTLTKTATEHLFRDGRASVLARIR